MGIKSFLYRRPSYLSPIDPKSIDTIVIHHTGNDNDIHVNTDYHMDTLAWNYLGYSYYIANGIPLKVRGYDCMGAGVSGHNDHTLHIAVQGNYNRDNVSDEDIEAVQECIYEILEHCPNVKYLKGHRDFGGTDCPGRNFPMDLLTLDKPVESVDNKYATVESVDKLREEIRRMKEFLEEHYQVRIR